MDSRRGHVAGFGRAFYGIAIEGPKSTVGPHPLRFAAQAAWWFGTLGKWWLLGVTRAPSAYFPTRWELLDTALAVAPTDGLSLEFGVFQGKSINHLAQQSGGREFFGFDSFEGLPSDWDSGRYRAGAFSLRGALPAVEPNVALVKGWFRDSLPGFLEAHPGSVSFLHIDCDLYESARFVIEQLSERIVPGTVIVFDEFGGFLATHEQRAFREVARARLWKVRYLGYSGRGEVALTVESTGAAQRSPDPTH